MNISEQCLSAWLKDGYFLHKLDSDDCNKIYDLVEGHLNARYRASKYFDPNSATLKLPTYHQSNCSSHHKELWPKTSRILSQSDTNSIIKLQSVNQLIDSLRGVEISDEENLGYPNIYWRLVRPNQQSDVGPLHRDEWFWKLNPQFKGPSSNLERIKIWLPLTFENKKNTLNVLPGSHLNDSIDWIGEYRDGIQKPILLSNITPNELKMIDFESNEAIVFHDRLLHGGSLNTASTTRTSIEFTVFSKKSHQ